MKKITLSVFAIGVMLLAISSCKKCYHCEKVLTVKDINGADSSVYYKNDLCNTGKEGAGNNLNKAVDDIEKNGYTCTSK